MAMLQNPYRFDPYTKLLIHMRGADESTSFLDASPSAHTITPVGDVQIDTAQYKFAPSSGLFDGTGDYLTVPNSADWHFADGNFTLDFWLRFSSLANCTFLNQYPSGNRSWQIYFSTSTGAHFTYSTDGSNGTDVAFAWSPSIDTWYHISFVRLGANLIGRIDGTQIGATHNIGASSIFDSASYLGVSKQSDYGGNYFPGHFQEIRILKGLGAWATDFTPPTKAYN